MEFHPLTWIYSSEEWSTSSIVLYSLLEYCGYFQYLDCTFCFGTSSVHRLYIFQITQVGRTAATEPNTDTGSQLKTPVQTRGRIGWTPPLWQSVEAWPIEGHLFAMGGYPLAGEEGPGGLRTCRDDLYMYHHGSSASDSV